MRASLLIPALLLIAVAARSDDDIYRVEVVVFAQDQAQALTAFRLGERLFDPVVPALSQLPEPLRPEPVVDAVFDPSDQDINDDFLSALFDDSAVADSENTPPVALQRLLEPVGNEFDAMVERLERHPLLEVLAAQRWYQRPVAFDSPEFLRLHNDRNLAPAPAIGVEEEAQTVFWPGIEHHGAVEEIEPVWELDGRVALTQGTYFHLWLDAYYRQDVPTALPFAQRTARGVEAVDHLVHALNGRHRLRPGDWLYFDSPYLGAVARVTRYEAPEPEQP